MEAVKETGALYSASAELRGDREIVMAAVKRNRRALCYAGRAEGRPGVHWRPSSSTGSRAVRLGERGDREIVMAAVKQDGSCWRRLGRAEGRP